jgi:hypothetical protein
MPLRHKRPDHTTRERTEEPENSAADALDTWITELAAALSVDATTIDHDQILELSRATHRGARAGDLLPRAELALEVAPGSHGPAKPDKARLLPTGENPGSTVPVGQRVLKALRSGREVNHAS